MFLNIQENISVLPAIFIENIVNDRGHNFVGQALLLWLKFGKNVLFWVYFIIKIHYFNNFSEKVWSKCAILGIFLFSKIHYLLIFQKKYTKVVKFIKYCMKFINFL